MHCDFLLTDRAGVYRCRRCGFLTLPTRFPPTKVHRICRTFDLSQQSPLELSDVPRLSRGLGDAVAKFIQRASFGKLKAKPGCGCHQRQQWLNRTFPYRQASPHDAGEKAAASRPPASSLSSPASILLRFPHGLGDAVQLTIVLKHLRRFRPHWTIDVAGKLGAHTLFDGLARRSLVDGRDPWHAEQYTLVRTLSWEEPLACYSDSPSTKAEQCLRNVFGIPPDPDLCRYEINPTDEARWAAYQYLDQIAGPQPDGGRFPVVVIHYQGNSARRRKNISEDVVREVVRKVVQMGYVALILDWETPPRSALVRDSENAPQSARGASSAAILRTPIRVYCPGVDHPLWNGIGCGDGATIAALIQLSTLFVGIDSGPAHVAGATDTPAIVVWTKHHPVHYYGLADHVTHLVPLDHLRHIRGDADAGERFFQVQYHFRTYQQLRRALPMLVEEKLRDSGKRSATPRRDQTTGADRLIVDGDVLVRSGHRAADMVIVRDVLLSDAYAIGELSTRPRTILDVGAHIGTFAVAAHRRWPRAEITCVEANHMNLECLQANAAGFADVVHAAATYEKRPLAVASTVFEGTENTGGSYVYVPRSKQKGGPTASLAALDPEVREDQRYRSDRRVLRAITLEQLIQRSGWQTIDLLKLDCEGCEIPLLEKSTSLERIRAIVGEYHDRRWFESIIKRRFQSWQLRILHDAEPGTFWLVNLTT